MTIDPRSACPLGRTGLEVTRLGFGGASIGGLFSAVADAERGRDGRATPGTSGSVPSTRRRCTATAPPSGGWASRSPAARATSSSCRRRSAGCVRPTRAIPPGADVDRQAFDGREDAFYVVQDRRSAWSSTTAADGVRRSLEESLERLGLDRIDIALIHDPDDHWRARDRGQAWPALARLRDGGRDPRRRRGHEPVGDAHPVRARGRLRRLPRRRPLHAARPGRPGRAAAALRRNGASAIVIGGVMNSGVLADPRPGAPVRLRPADPGRRSIGRDGSAPSATATACRCERRRSSSRSPIRRSRRWSPGSARIDAPRRVPGAHAPPDPGRPLGRAASRGPHRAPMRPSPRAPGGGP